MLNLPPTADAELNADCTQARESMGTIYGLFFLQRWRKIFFRSLKTIRELRFLQRCSERGPWAGARRGDHRCATQFTNTASSYFCCANQAKMPQIQYWFVSGDCYHCARSILLPPERASKMLPTFRVGLAPKKLQVLPNTLWMSATHG